MIMSFLPSLGVIPECMMLNSFGRWSLKRRTGTLVRRSKRSPPRCGVI
jgi:hypothetical protein